MLCTQCRWLRLKKFGSDCQISPVWNYGFWRPELKLKFTRLCSTLAKEKVDYSGAEQKGRTILDRKLGWIRVANSGTRWQSVIGLEVHSQMKTNSKLFSAAPYQYNQPVNSQVSYFDAAVPGTLPVLNSRSVTAGVTASLALEANINLISYFDRKHYFYADLPAGYQITQHRRPISQGGSITFPVRCEGVKPYRKTSNLVQIQIEQDSGKSLHDPDGGNSLIDLNRCGVGLLELVFAPDLQTGEEAAALAKELTLILQKIQVCGGRMERGEIRVDANISVRKIGDPLGTRTEVKNLNSLRAVVRSVEFEVWRQINCLENGETIENETRGYDIETRQTVSMRDKERKQDYRFMPEPNLPPLVLEPAMVETLKASLPELPSQTRTKLQMEYKLSEDCAVQLVEKPYLLDLFKECVAIDAKNSVALANIILLVVQEFLAETDMELVDQCNTDGVGEGLTSTCGGSAVSVTGQALVDAVNLRHQRVINYTALRELVRLLLSGDKRSPLEIVEDKGWTLITDTKVIQEFVDDVLMKNQELVNKYKKAKEKKKGLHLNKLLVEANKDDRTGKVDMAVFTNILKQSLS